MHRSLALLLLIACASRRAPPAETPPEGAPPGETLPEGAPTDDFEGTTGVVHVERRVPVATVVDVRTGVHERYDRVVFEFDGEIPGWHVEYVDRPQHRCGSGDQVFLPGDGWLEVRLTPARMHTDEGRATVADRSRRELGGQLRALESTCDFEGEVTWVLGLDSPEPFRVLTLGDPPRIAVDVRRPER